MIIHSHVRNQKGKGKGKVKVKRKIHPITDHEVPEGK